MLNTEIDDPWKEVFTLVQIATAKNTARPERRFCALKSAQTSLRSTTSADRLSALVMLSVEKAMMESIINFNDKVAERFANHKKESGLSCK